ncbi:MAG: glycosyltransferase [archaeon]
MKKVSFLMAAHNEEKIIYHSLNNLLNLTYGNYEVLIGLDGCTDGTEEIVREFCSKSKNFRYFKLNLRSGKPAVINALIKKARGTIIIVNDADWIFSVHSKKDFSKLISNFNDSKVGGIAESLPIEWDKDKMKKGNLGYLMVAYSSYFWMEFQKKFYSYEKKGKRYLKGPEMFMTNIFRRELYKPNTSLGDDFERTYDIMNEGKSVILIENAPRMVSYLNHISLFDLFKQKIRTAKAREQINRKGMSIPGSYYLKVIIFMIKESFKSGIKTGVLTSSWIILTSLATMISKIMRFDTKKGWSMRIRR